MGADDARSKKIKLLIAAIVLVGSGLALVVNLGHYALWADEAGTPDRAGHRFTVSAGVAIFELRRPVRLSAFGLSDLAKPRAEVAARGLAGPDRPAGADRRRGGLGVERARDGQRPRVLREHVR